MTANKAANGSKGQAPGQSSDQNSGRNRSRNRGRGKRRARVIPEPARWSGRLYVRLAPANAARLKFLLEGYDNLAYQSTIDRRTALLQLTFSPDQEAEVREFLESVRVELGLEVVEL